MDFIRRSLNIPVKGRIRGECLAILISRPNVVFEQALMKKSNPATVPNPAKCIYNIVMIYEWDEAKNAANIVAGRLGFEAIEDFEWETAIITSSPRRGENRLAALGLIADKLYQVVYIRREDTTRVISLRLASRKERG